MTDVRLFQTDDGGEIIFENGILELASVEIETCVYLALFGGNSDDNGTDATASKQWWGNYTETEPSKQYRSETQARILGSKNLAADILDIEAAARRDLQFLLDEEISSEVEVSASVPGYNRLDLFVNVVVDNEEYAFVFKQMVNL